MLIAIILLVIAAALGLFYWRGPSELVVPNGPVIVIVILAVLGVAAFVFTVWAFAVHPLIASACVLALWTLGMVWAYRELKKQQIGGFDRIWMTVAWPFTLWLLLAGMVQ